MFDHRTSDAVHRASSTHGVLVNELAFGEHGHVGQAAYDTRSVAMKDVFDCFGVCFIIENLTS